MGHEIKLFFLLATIILRVYYSVVAFLSRIFIFHVIMVKKLLHLIHLLILGAAHERNERVAQIF